MPSWPHCSCAPRGRAASAISTTSSPIHARSFRRATEATCSSARPSPRQFPVDELPLALVPDVLLLLLLLLLLLPLELLAVTPLLVTAKQTWDSFQSSPSQVHAGAQPEVPAAPQCKVGLVQGVPS